MFAQQSWRLRHLLSVGLSRGSERLVLEGEIPDDVTRSMGAVFAGEHERLVRVAYLLTGSSRWRRMSFRTAFVRLHRHWDGVRQPSAYLRVTVVNGCSAHHRRNRRERSHFPELVTDTVVPETPVVLDALLELPYRQRAALVLRFYEDRPDSEIAQALGCRPATVRSLVHRGTRDAEKGDPAVNGRDQSIESRCGPRSRRCRPDRGPADVLDDDSRAHGAAGRDACAGDCRDCRLSRRRAGHRRGTPLLRWQPPVLGADAHAPAGRGCRGVRGKGVREQQRRWHGLSDHHHDRCGVSPITIGARPTGVAITPDGTHAYVTNVIDGTVSVITTATGVVSAPITVGKAPVGVAITPDGKHVYVTNNADGTVSVITTATGAVSPPITVGNGPDGIAVTPDGKHVYVANDGGSTVSVITTATGALSAPITVGNAPHGVAITPDGKHVYVANNGGGTVSVITTATGAVSAPVIVGNGPEQVAITPDGTHAYVTNNADGTVSVITTATGAVSPPITVGSRPVGVAITPDGKQVYVTNSSVDNFVTNDVAANGAGTVSVITTATGAVSPPITVGNGPINMAICPA